jgi:hypothetical protein
MSSVLSQVGRWCRDQIVGPQLPTYDRACEELGGAPWRPKPEATDRWFIVETPARPRRASPPPIPRSALLPPPPSAALLPPAPSPDDDAFVLKKSLSESAKLTMLGGTAAAVIVVCLLSLVGGRAASTPPALIGNTQAASAPVLLAAVTQPIASPASIVAVKSSAPHATLAHHAAAKRHVAARHRRR